MFSQLCTKGTTEVSENDCREFHISEQMLLVFFLPRPGVLSGVYLDSAVADVWYSSTQPWININIGGQCCPPHTPTCFQLFLLSALGVAGPDGELGQQKDLKWSPLYKKVVSLKNEALALTTDVKKIPQEAWSFARRTEQLLNKSSNQLVRKLPLRKWKKWNRICLLNIYVAERKSPARRQTPLQTTH